MPKPKNWLRMKSIEAISLVDKGDNPKADIVIHKRRAQVAKADATTFSEALGATRVNQDIWQYQDALHTAIRNAMESEGGDKAKLIGTSIDQFAAAMKEALPTWVGGESTEETTMEKTEKVGLLKTFAKALGFTDEELTKVTPPAPAPEAPKETPVDKSAIEALQKRVDDEATARKAAEERVQKLEDEREVSTFVTKAAALKNLPGVTGDDFGPILRKISKALTKEEFEKFEKILRGADALIEKSDLFDEVGSDAQGDAGSPTAKVAALVEKAMKADPKLTETQARAKVYRDNPELIEDVEEADTEARSKRRR